MFDLVATALRVAHENGFVPELPRAAAEEVSALRAPSADGARDLRALPWSSIDNAESMDLDQIEVAERLGEGRARVRVAIADVDVLVPEGSALDLHARENTCSLYTGPVTFPMLPDALSTGLTSLLPGEDRVAIVIEMIVDDGGAVVEADVYRALVTNHAKLVYDDVAAWLGGDAAPPPVFGQMPILADQVRLQDDFAQRLRTRRYERGALDLETLEAQPIVRDGQVVDLAVIRESRARQIIEDFMIAANRALARFLDARGASSIRRVVRTPERWQRIVELAKGYGDSLPETPSATALSEFLARRKAADPTRFADLSLAVVKLMGPGEYALDRAGKSREGHFGLAVQDYAHATAPNRRYADLVTQRVTKAVIARGTAPYSDDDLAGIAARCTQKDHDARKVERTMKKIAAALLLSSRIGQEFDGIVTGVMPKGTFVRTLAPPADGRIVKGEQGLDVGDKVRVRLVAAEPSRGFLDFVKV